MIGPQLILIDGHAVIVGQSDELAFVQSRTRPDLWHKVEDRGGVGEPTNCSCEDGTMNRNPRCWHLDLVLPHWNDYDKFGIRKMVESPDPEAEVWVYIGEFFGFSRMPASSAAVVKRAIEEMTNRKEVSDKAPWMALEYLAGEYLISKGKSRGPIRKKRKRAGAGDSAGA
jgi:hypothetical protein